MTISVGDKMPEGNRLVFNERELLALRQAGQIAEKARCMLTTSALREGLAEVDSMCAYLFEGGDKGTEIE